MLGAVGQMLWPLWCPAEQGQDRVVLGLQAVGHSLPGDTAEPLSAPWGWVGNGGDVAPAPRRDVGLFPVAVTVSPTVPEGRKRAAANPSSPAASPGTTWGCLAPGTRRMR